jgi:hypothetical protein
MEQIIRRRIKYDVEHVPIKSSQAEFSNINSPDASSSVYDYDVEDLPTISPLIVPKVEEMGSVNFLRAYEKWRDSVEVPDTASQGSVHIEVPTYEEDNFVTKDEKVGNQQPIHDDYLHAQDYPGVNHMRSRSALGIREYRDRQFSGGAEPIYGITRAATTNLLPNAAQDYGVTESTTTDDFMDLPTSPLTPFIKRMGGAPPGVDHGGAKKLFGEHGFLEDTAKSDAKKPKMEKTGGGIIEGFRRIAREIVRHPLTRCDLSPTMIRTFVKLTFVFFPLYIGGQHIVQTNSPQRSN